MADLWGSLIGAGASLLGSSMARSDAKEQAATAAGYAPNTTQQASLWQNQQNMGNQTWAQQQNQNAMNAAGLGSNTNAFGTSTRTQGADGAWNVNNVMDAGDQATLNALRTNSLSGAGNLDMSGAYNVDSNYAKNYDALNRPALEQNQQAQRDRAAAMGLGWGSGQGNDTLNSQLNDEQTRFGMATQNAGHDAWLSDQQNLRANMGVNETAMNGLSGRQTAAPEWGPYATVNAPTSAIVNKGNMDSSLGWSGGSLGGTGSSTYDGMRSVPSSNWLGGSLSGAGSSTW